MNIREAQPNDLSAIRSLIAYLMKVEESDDVEEQTSKIMSVRIEPSFNSDISKTFVAEQENKIIGVLLVELKHSLVASLAYAAVSPTYQKQGIGKKLVDQAIEFAKTKGIHIIDVLVHKDNQNSKEFHEKLGFELFGSLLRKEI